MKETSRSHRRWAHGRWANRRWAQALAALSVLSAAAVPASMAAASTHAHSTHAHSTSRTITIGLSEPTSGVEAALAPYGYGMQAYFDQQDAKGGFDGLKVKVDIFNDNYDPTQALTNAEQAVQQDHVFAFTGIGIPENDVRAYLNQEKVPQVFVDSADVTFSSPPKVYPYSRAWLMSIGDEGYLDAQFALAHAEGSPKLCTIALAGSLAAELQAGVATAVKHAGKGSVVQNATYAITQPNVDSQVLQLRQAGCTVLIANLAGAGASLMPAYLGTIGWHPTTFLMNANVSRLTIEAEGPSNYKNIYSALTSMDPADPKYARTSAIERYKEAILKYAPSGTAPSGTYAFDGYLAGEALGYAIGHMSSVSAAGLLEAIDGMHEVEIPGLLPGVELNYGPGGRLMFEAQISRFSGSAWVAVGPVVSARSAGTIGYSAGLTAG